MAGLKPPGPLSFQGNVATNWKDWLMSYELYETATELLKKGDEVRYATFLHVAGATAQRIAKTFELTSGESGKVDALKKKFAAYCQPRKNLSVLRYMFNPRNQRADESFRCSFGIVFLFFLCHGVIHCQLDMSGEAGHNMMKLIFDIKMRGYIKLCRALWRAI